MIRVSASLLMPNYIIITVLSLDGIGKKGLNGLMTLSTIRRVEMGVILIDRLGGD